MKKNKIFSIKTILSFAAATLFFACSNLGGDSVSNAVGGLNAVGGQDGAQAPVMVTVNGSLAFGGTYPEQIAALVENSGADGLDGIARSAFPDAASSGLTYSVYALEDLPSGSTDTPLRYEGAVALDKKSYTVGIPVLTGKKYNVFAEVKNGGITVLSGQSAKVIEAPSGESSFVTDANITLAATQTSGKKGCVQLTVNVQDAGISSARAVYIDPSDGSQKAIDGESGLGGNTLTFSVGIDDEDEPDPESGLASGAYLMTFNFYSEADCGGNLLYSFPEAVNVFDGMTTNKWVKNGAEPWLTPDSSGNIACKITAAMVTGFGLTDIYVDLDAPDDSGSGSFMHPKKTFAAAVGMLQNASADYTIHIKGPVNGPQTISSTISAKSLTLCGETPIPTEGPAKGIPRDIIDACLAYGSALLIETTVPITIKNLKITGGRGAVDGGYAYGGGICLKAEGGSLTLASGAYVSENKARAEGESGKGRGAGICLYPACRLNILDGAVIENNESDGSGGGIFCKRLSGYSPHEITMSGGHIRGNTAATYGGALDMEYGTFTMTGGVIGDDSTSISLAAKYGDDARQSPYSNAAKLGGAIYSWGSGPGNFNISLLGGTIAYNYAKNSGGAIYLSGGNMTVKNAKIQYNGAGDETGGLAAVGEGGALRFERNGDLHLEDCSIIGNECYQCSGGEAKGGAICVLGTLNTSYNPNIYLKGSVSIPSDGKLKNDIVLQKYNNTSAAFYECPALTIEGKLTGSGKIARLTPTTNDYDDMYRRVVLKLASGVTDTSLAQEFYKFDVTPQRSIVSGDVQTWIVSGDGKLKKSTVLTNENIDSFTAPNAECHLVIGPDVTSEMFKNFLYNLFVSSGDQVGPASTLDLSQATQLDGTEWNEMAASPRLQPFETVIISPSFGEAWAGIESAHISLNKVGNLVAPSNNENLVSKDGVLFSKDEKKILFWPGNKAGPEAGGIPTTINYTIPDTVTEIGTLAFSFAIYLTSVTIPESVKKIGKYGLPFDSGWVGALIFNNPDGWHKNDLSGDAVSSSDLTAAKYIAELKSYVLVRE